MAVVTDKIFNLAEDRFYIVGMGGHAKVVAEAASLRYFGKMVTVIVVDAYNKAIEGSSFCGFKVINIDDLEGLKRNPFIIAEGNSEIRESLTNKMMSMGHVLTELQHPDSSVAKDVEIGRGTFIARGVSVNSGVKVGWNCILNTGCSVDHDCEIGEYSHIAPGSTLAGYVKVGKHSSVFAGATIIPEIKIGDNVTVGAGAVVIRDVEDYSTVVGNPARTIKSSLKSL